MITEARDSLYFSVCFSHTAHHGACTAFGREQVTSAWLRSGPPRWGESCPPPKCGSPCPFAGLELFSRRKWVLAKVVCGAWECAIRERRGRGVLCQPVALPGSRPQLPVAAFTAAERGRPHALSHSSSLPEGALAMAGTPRSCFVLA